MKSIMLSQINALFSILFLVLASSSYAAYPVIDVPNLKQNFRNTIENVAQTLKQIEQYRTQLQQYENMLQNTESLENYEWDNANQTITNLLGAIDTLNVYAEQAGGMNEYLSQFQDTDHYRDTPCFSGANCNQAELANLDQSIRYGTAIQKQANDGVIKGIDQQQDNLKNDAQQLTELQSGAQDSIGQMQALQFANQFASNQAHQLLQIRALLISQQNAEVTRAQVINDQESKAEAASEQIRKGEFVPSSAREW